MLRVHETLKARLAAAGVRAVEERIGRPSQFFSKTREHDRLRLADFLATCAVLEEDPDALLGQALDGDVPPEVRPPRVVKSAWARIERTDPSSEIASDRLSKLRNRLQVDPEGTRKRVAQALESASREQLPELLGIYASALRAEADHSHAHLVFREATRMARALGAPAAEAGLLIRWAYLALEYRGPRHALRRAQDALVSYPRLNDREGEGTSFLAMGTFRYYSRDFATAIADLQAALERTTLPRRIITAHQAQAFSWIELGEEEAAQAAAAAARAWAPRVEVWIQAKLSWLEARLSYGETRIGHLQDAQGQLAPSRPSDGILVTIELIEEYLALSRLADAAGEVPRLCTLIEQASEAVQVQRAVSKLIHHRTRLTPKHVALLREALDRARDRKLANLAGTDL